ncbi:MAG: c-type cytochrome [Chitinophagaceae bacterium]|nr:c-type cytochrome [Chitinophagaceae bacterium]
MKKYIILLFSVVAYFSCKKDPKVIDSNSNFNATPYEYKVPLGLNKVPVPADNPLTVEGVYLGRMLFYEKQLSANNTQSCASCHLQNRFMNDSLRFSVGIDGIFGKRNAMPLFNVGYATSFFWDGGAPTLEKQALDPILNPIEMHNTMENVISKLKADAKYPTLFSKAFGSEEINTTRVLKAIAQFERTILSGNSKFDLWHNGLATFTESEYRGYELFLNNDKGDCFHCHTLGGYFTDFEFRNNGLDSIPVDLGRARITHNPLDEGKFKTPTLRNIEFTAPYMHDGRFNTLEEVVQHYNKNFYYTQNLDPLIQVIPKNRLSLAEVQDLISFLKTLTDTSFINNPAYSDPN